MMFQAPLLAVYPGVAIVLSVLGLNLMGDGLRDLMDPEAGAAALNGPRRGPGARRRQIGCGRDGAGGQPRR